MKVPFLFFSIYITYILLCLFVTEYFFFIFCFIVDNNETFLSKMLLVPKSSEYFAFRVVPINLHQETPANQLPARFCRTKAG